MNAFMGGRTTKLGPIPQSAQNYIWFYRKDSEIRRPSELWVLLDEDERSINDGFFVTDPTAREWLDFPALSAHRHNYSFGLNFADGHSKIWAVRDPRSRSVSHHKTEQAHNTDLEQLGRLEHHANQNECVVGLEWSATVLGRSRWERGEASG